MNFAKKISSPVGELFLVATDDALIALDCTPGDLYKKAQKVEKQKILNLTEKQLNEYFKGKRTEFNLPLKPEGTEFQKKVWNALLKIPYGKVWSYGQQASYLKNPKACRAVGGANGKNPIAIIIPCHRVISSTGKMTGYASGLNMKVSLLKLEGHHVDGLQLK